MRGLIFLLFFGVIISACSDYSTVVSDSGSYSNENDAGEDDSYDSPGEREAVSDIELEYDELDESDFEEDLDSDEICPQAEELCIAKRSICRGNAVYKCNIVKGSGECDFSESFEELDEECSLKEMICDSVQNEDGDVGEEAICRNTSCEDLACDELLNSHCEVVGDSAECVCDDGYAEIEGDCLLMTECPDGIRQDSELSDKNTIATLNTLHLGWNNKDVTSLACVVSHFDLIGLAEVESEEGLIDLDRELELMTGEKWEYKISEYEVGNNSYKEFYGYVWKADAAVLNDSPGFYQEIGNEFVREPYGSDFTFAGVDFTFVIFHIIYGDSVGERRAEVQHLSEVYSHYQELYPGIDNVLLGGDFNLPVDDDAFNSLLSMDDMFHVVTPEMKTTIGNSGLSSSYDNIFYPGVYMSDIVIESGVYDFTDNNHSEVRKSVTDHIPVWISIE